MRQNGQNLEGKTTLDVSKVDHRVLEVVKDEHEEESKANRKHNASAEYDCRVGQHGLRRDVRRTTDRNDFVYRLGV